MKLFFHSEELMQNFALRFISVLLVSLPFLAQTTIEMDDFNAAYFQYGEMKDTDPDIAREAARRAYEMGKDLFGAKSERSAMLAVNYATLIENESDARSYLDEAVEIYQLVFGFDSEGMINPLIGLGLRLSEQEKSDLGEEYYSRALRLSERHLGPNSTKTGYIELELGAILLKAGRLNDSWRHLQSAKHILSQYTDSGSKSGLTRTYLLIGEYYLARQDYRAAIEPLLISLKDFDSFPSANITVRNHVDLIKAYENLNESVNATFHCLAIGATRRLAKGENLEPVFRVPVQRVGEENSLIGVKVYFTVDREGYAVDPVITEELKNSELSVALIKAIKQFRFAPRFLAGKAVDSPEQYFEF